MRTKSQLNILLLFFRFFRVCTRRDTICPLFFFVFFFFNLFLRFEMDLQILLCIFTSHSMFQNYLPKIY